MAALIGRAAELTAVADLLRRARCGCAGLALVGAAGSGKSAVLDAATDRATADGWRVLRCHGDEADTALSFVGITDLLTSVARELDDWLPPPQRRALQVAMLRAASDGEVVERHSVGRAVAGSLRALSATTPVLVIVDDVQWLDLESLHALRFALRRLDAAPIAVLTAQRATEGQPTELTSGPLLSLSPLTPDEVEQLLLEHGCTLSRATLRRIQNVAGGHPMYALELARHFAVNPAAPVPRSLMALLDTRLQQLPSAALPVLAAAAQLSAPSRPVVHVAVDQPIATVDEAIDAAIDAGIVTETDGAVRFTHPLLAEAASATQSSAWRRSVHRRLADVVADVEQRAVHLSRAATEPDEHVAALIQAGASRARARGAAEVAGELITAALRLTPVDQKDALRRRRVDGAYHLVAAGRPERAAELLLAAVDDEPEDSVQRADLLWRAGMMQFLAGDIASTVELLEAAHASTTDDVLREELNTRLANMHIWRGDTSRGAELGARVDVEHVAGIVRVNALATRSVAHFLRGEPDPIDPWDAVAEYEQLDPPAPAHEHPLVRLVHALTMTSRTAEVARIATETAARAAADDDDLGVAWLGATAAYAELRAGRWEAAARMAADAMRAARRADSRPALIPALQAAATVAAYRGDAAAATELAQELIAFGPARELLLGARHGHVVLGFLALSAGDAGTACEHYVRASASLDVVVPLQPAVPPLRWFVVDALLDAGDLDAATRVTEHLESLTDNALAAAVAATARGRLASIRGDRGAADAAFAQALLAHDRLGWPFERAVTQYHYGCALHDQRRRALARSVLGAARDAFDALGASAWTTRAQTALAAISGRAPAGPQALTRAEDEVAALAASGLTNQQIAQRLFVSPKTVATHLSHTYAKLNVRSRTELAARMRRTGPHDHNGQSTTLADE